jgi:serpin B
VINEWVSDQTEKKIQDLIPEGSIDTLTRLILTNAIYFNADWQSPFEEADTADGVFTTLNDSTVSVPMMSQLGDFAYGEAAGVQVIDLPYYGDEVSMVIFLPAKGEFSGFERSLNPETLQAMLANLERKSVNLRMPKFEFSSEFELVNTLAKMGMPSAFSAEADFSGMDGTRDLSISGVLHKAYVAVDEAGTEAAAATGVIVGITSIPLSDVDMLIDRPFVFGIRDNATGTLLFLGRVLDPS